MEHFACGDKTVCVQWGCGTLRFLYVETTGFDNSLAVWMPCMWHAWHLATHAADRLVYRSLRFLYYNASLSPS